MPIGYTESNRNKTLSAIAMMNKMIVVESEPKPEDKQKERKKERKEEEEEEEEEERMNMTRNMIQIHHEQ